MPQELIEQLKQAEAMGDRNQVMAILRRIKAHQEQEMKSGEHEGAWRGQGGHDAGLVPADH